jgi:succinyl-CoA synthetase beta subunit
MNLHEYQAKELLARHGVGVPRGRLARRPAEAVEAARALGGKLWVVKAQVHSGGRGKAGGVVLCRSPQDVETAAERLLGSRLVTHQSGGTGLPVEAVWIEEGTAIKRELYLSLLVDRTRPALAFVASTDGGMEIEEVARTHPERIVTVALPPTGYAPYVGRRLGFALGLEPDQRTALASLVEILAKLFVSVDASLVEINPLVVTDDGALRVLDAKITLDDNAIGRHPDLAAWDDPHQRPPTEIEAERAGLNYVALEGTIGCMVNGAGLAMATMDLIKLSGGEPANFLDVGGDATAERVTAAFRIILSNPQVRAVLVNIFGGIVRCDLIAEGIVQAVREVGVRVPVVVRLEGTRAEEGRELLARSGVRIVPVRGLAEAAQRVVQEARAS